MIGDIGWAIECMRDGAKVTRRAWEGEPSAWICLSPGMPDCPADKLWAPANRQYAEQAGGTATVLPYLTKKTGHGNIVPWLPSQVDLLAQDWELSWISARH